MSKTKTDPVEDFQKQCVDQEYVCSMLLTE